MPAPARRRSKASSAPPKPPKPVEWYPIRFREIFKPKIWGAGELKKIFGKKCPPKTGESWEISQLGDECSVVANGVLKGWTLDRLMEVHRQPLLGNEHYMRFHKRFPLLVKFLAPHDRLSLQVHPTDDFAQRYEMHGLGKVEAWYVVHAPKEARVIRGVLPGTTVAEFRQHLTAGKVEECLNVMEVEEGDVIFLPPGTLHSAFGGAVFVEVQPTADVTYRLTDWGRTDARGKSRPLDVEKAMSVIDFHSMGVSKHRPARIPGYPYKRKLLIKCEKFTMESIELDRKRVSEKSDPNRFLIFTVVRGAGKFCFGPKKKKAQPFKSGETYLIPAALGEYDIAAKGNSEIVCTYVE